MRIFLVRRVIAIGMVTLTNFLSVPSWAVSCNKTLEKEAEAAVDNLRPNWQDIYEYYTKFGKNCPDVGAGNVSDIVEQSFSKNWGNLDTLSKLSAKNPGYKKYVLTNINSTISDPDRIGDLATKNCPRGLEALCKEISSVVELAIKNDPSYTGSSSKSRLQECAKPDRWAASMAQTYLKNANLFRPDEMDFSKTEVFLLASEKVRENLFHQIQKIVFRKKSGSKIIVITENDASKEECSMSDVKAYLVEKVLGP